MEYNPLNGLNEEQFDEQRDYQENKALLAGHLAHGSVGATFATRSEAEKALLALMEAGFEDTTLDAVSPEDVRRASLAASAAQSTTPAEHPNPQASAEPAHPYVADMLEGNGAVHMAVVAKTQAGEVQDILQQHGGKLDVTTDKGAS